MKTAVIDIATNKIKIKFEGTPTLPENFTDPTKVLTLTVPDEMDLESIDYAMIAVVEEFWSKDGETDVTVQPTYSIATWTKFGETPVTVDPLDEAWTAHAIGDDDLSWVYNPEVPSHMGIIEDQTLVTAKLTGTRDKKVNDLRDLRKPIFDDFDNMVRVFTLSELNAKTDTALKTYRQELKDVTNLYKNHVTDEQHAIDVDALDLGN